MGGGKIHTEVRAPKVGDSEVVRRYSSKLEVVGRATKIRPNPVGGPFRTSIKVDRKQLIRRRHIR